MSYWDEIVKNNVGSAPQPKPTLPAASPAPTAPGGFWASIQPKIEPSVPSQAPASPAPIPSQNFWAGFVAPHSIKLGIQAPPSTQSQSTPALATKPATPIKDVADYLFNPKAEIAYPNLPFTTPEEQETLGKLQGPRIITGPAKAINDTFVGLFEMVPRAGVRVYQAIKGLTGKNQEVQLPFNPERLGIPSENQKTVKPLGTEALDRVQKLDQERPELPTLNLLQGTLETVGGAVLDVIVTGDLVKQFTRTILTATKSSPMLGVSAQSIKDLSPSDAVTEVFSRFKNKASEIIDANTGADGILSNAGRRQIRQLAAETQRLGRAFSDQSIPELNAVGRIFDNASIRLNQDVGDILKTTGLSVPRVVSPSESLPGYKPSYPKPFAAGLSTEPVEPVGFGPEKKMPLSDLKKEFQPGGNSYNTMSTYDKYIALGDYNASDVYADATKKIYKPEIARQVISDASTDLTRRGYPDLAKALEETLSPNNLTPDKLIKAANDLISGQEAKEVFTGSNELTTKVLDRLIGRSSVSPQFISDLSNAADLKQPERELIRRILGEYPGLSTIPVKEFAEKVQQELLPLEQTRGGNEYENIVLPEDIRGDIEGYGTNVYQSPIKTSAGDVHFGTQGLYDGVLPPDRYFAHTRTEDVAGSSDLRVPGKVRRILELQSDLFQKGRLEGERNVDVGYDYPASEAGLKNLGYKPEESAKMLAKRDAELAKLEPYRNTWQDRIIREEVRQAAKDGKTTLLFPTGETAMKIEGLGDVRGNRFTFLDGTAMKKLTPDNLKVGRTIVGNSDNWMITDVLGDGKFKAVPKGYFDELVAETPKDTKLDLMKIAGGSSSAEQFDISGKLDTNNPIYKFYEKEVARYLKNQYGATPYTDPQGVTWFKVKVPKDAAEAPVSAFKLGPEGGKNEFSLVEIRQGLKDLLGKDIPVEGILDESTMSRPGAIGELVNGVIRLLEKNGSYSDAVAKHEAWHFMKRFLVTKAERMRMIEIENELAKAFPGRLKKLIESGYSAREAPEELAADELSRFSRTGKGLTERIKIFFDKILQRLQILFKNKKKVLDYFKDLKGKVSENPDVVKTKPASKLGDEKIPNRILSETERKSLMDQSADLKKKIPVASEAARIVMVQQLNAITRQLRRSETISRKVSEKSARLTRQGNQYTPGSQSIAEIFNKSGGQTVVGSSHGVDFEVGDFGRKHSDRKSTEGKFNRFPESELSETVDHIVDAYRASDNPTQYRYDNIAWRAEMPDGTERYIYTRKNANGAEEIISWHDTKAGPINADTYRKTLESYGTPTQQRTGTFPLGGERSSSASGGVKDSSTLGGIRTRSSPFRSRMPVHPDESNSTLSKSPNSVKGDNIVLSRPTKADRIETDRGSRELKIATKKAALEANLKIKLPKSLEDKATALSLRKDVLDQNPLKNLVKFMSKSGEFKGRLSEVTGKPKTSIFGQFGDRFISEATGIKDSEEARSAFEKYMADRKKFESDMATFQKEKNEFLADARAKRDEAIANQKIGRMHEKTERQISEILGNKAEREARIERVKQKEAETQERLKEMATMQAKYQKQVEEAHLNSAQKRTLLSRFKAYLSPIEETDAGTKKIYLDWETAKIRGKEDANKLYEKYAGHVQNEFPDIIEYQAGSQTPWIRLAFDDLFTEAQRAGVEPRYKDNYIPQVYRERSEKIQEAIVKYMKDKGVGPEIIREYEKTGEVPEGISVRLKINPSFQKIRTFPDYKTAMKYGLTPRFRTVAEHLAYYKEELSKTVANKKLIADLVKEGKVLDAHDAPDDWIEVKLPGRQFRTYYAPKNLADALNGQFRDEENLTGLQTLAKYGAKASQLMQEINLSAGVPSTNINFFSIGQAVKMLTTGLGEAAKLNLGGTATSLRAASAFIRANFNARSIRFFKDNQKYIDLMGDRNISVARRIGDFADNHKAWRQIFTRTTKRELSAALKSTWKDVKGIRSPADAGKAVVNIFESRLVGVPKAVFDKFFNEKTFSSFMPQMQVQVFKDIFERAMKDGLDEKGAADFAADTVRNEFGLINELGRTQSTKDAIGSIFFAPKFREGIVNVFKNAAKSGTTEFRNPSYARSRSLILGMIISYVVYNLINRRLNGGDNMWDNEPGREFSLKIPLPGGKIVYTPFMPSVLSFIRNMGSAAIGFARGDNETALQKAGTLLSMPLQAGTEIISNKDYYGRPIYDIVDSPYEKAKKAIQYLGLSITHPYFNALYRYFTGTQDIYQTLAVASELPLTFSTEEKAALSRYYDEKDARSELNARERKDISGMISTYDEVQSLKADNNLTTASNIIDNLSSKEYEQYQSIMRYEQIQALRKAKKTDEAKTILNGLTDDEYLEYQAIKSIRTTAKSKETRQKNISKETKPTFYNGQQINKNSLLETIATYAYAVTSDPETAFQRIFSGQKIRRVDNDTIIVERMSLADSFGLKTKQGYKPGDDLALDHTVPLELGGDNSVDNLKLVPKATWESYTPVENHLGRLLRDGKITKVEAQRLITSFKSGNTSADDIMKL